jgi:hypothetical protein
MADAAKYYAWSNILGGTPEKPVKFAPGDEISKSAGGFSDTDWDTFVREGIVREQPWPKTAGAFVAPADHAKRLLAHVGEGGVLNKDQVSDLNTLGFGEPGAAPEIADTTAAHEAGGAVDTNGPTTPKQAS